MRALSPGNEFRPDDYVGLSTIKDSMVGIGVPDASVDAHLQTLIRFGLLQPDTLTPLDEANSVEHEFERMSSVHITAAGQYYLDTLCGIFQYLQRIIPDVPIRDHNTAETLQEYYAPFKNKPYLMPIEAALSGVETLLEYLRSEEGREHDEGIVARDPLIASAHFVDDIENRLAPQFVAIRKWINKEREVSNQALEDIGA